jgi:hypothetical protein
VAQHVNYAAGIIGFVALLGSAVTFTASHINQVLLENEQWIDSVKIATMKYPGDVVFVNLH